MTIPESSAGLRHPRDRPPYGGLHAESVPRARRRSLLRFGVTDMGPAREIDRGAIEVLGCGGSTNPLAVTSPSATAGSAAVHRPRTTSTPDSTSSSLTLGQLAHSFSQLGSVESHNLRDVCHRFPGKTGRGLRQKNVARR